MSRPERGPPPPYLAPAPADRVQRSRCLAAALVTAGTLAYSNDRLSEVERVDLSDVTAAEELAAGDPQNYLIVGVDDASGLGEGDSVKNRESGDLAGQHTDSIMVLRIDPAEATARLLSFPRDLWVPIAGSDSNQRINTALSTGGAERLIQTIDEDFGIPIHHYLQVDFADFKTLVEEIDGVPVQFPRPARAASSGLVIEEPGCWILGPDQALGFSRARKDYQVRDDDGDWHTDPGVDFSRVQRQQLFIQLAMRRAIAKGARNPNTPPAAWSTWGSPPSASTTPSTEATWSTWAPGSGASTPPTSRRSPCRSPTTWWAAPRCSSSRRRRPSPSCRSSGATPPSTPTAPRPGTSPSRSATARPPRARPVRSPPTWPTPASRPWCPPTARSGCPPRSSTGPGRPPRPSWWPVTWSGRSSTRSRRPSTGPTWWW